MDGGSGSSSDEKGSVHASGGHLSADLLHSVQGRSDESTHADNVGSNLHSLVQQRITRHHHAEVGNVEPAACQYDGSDVLADVVDVALDGGDEESRLVAGSLVRSHIRLEYGHSIAHHPGGLDDLREEHPSVSEKLAHFFHSGHQRPLYHSDCATKLFQAFQSIFFQAL